MQLRWQELVIRPNEPATPRSRTLARIFGPVLASLVALSGAGHRPHVSLGRRNLRRSFVIATLMLFAGAAAACESSNDNPGWPSSGPVSVVLLMDRSSSVGHSNHGGSGANVENAKAAAKDFAKALQDSSCGTKLAIVPFATAPVTSWDDIPTNANQQARDDRIAGIPYMMFGNTWSQLANGPDGYPYRDNPTPGSTNWDAALKRANEIHNGRNASASSRLTIMISDGEPTYNDSAEKGNSLYDFDSVDLNEAVKSANALKASGSRVVAIQVGPLKSLKSGNKTYSSEDTLKAITGNTANNDYFMSNYGALTTQLKSLATNSCKPPTTTTTPPATSAGLKPT